MHGFDWAWWYYLASERRYIQTSRNQLRYGFYCRNLQNRSWLERFVYQSRTPHAKPRVRRGVCIIYRSRKEVLVMYLLMLFVFLILLRKRRTKLKIDIDL